MAHAAGRDPLILSAKTGLGPQSADVHAEIDLIYSMLGGTQQALLRIAREIDEMKGA